MITQKDKSIVRELAKQYMALVTTEKQVKMRQRARDTNDLKLVRPPVILDEIPWYQVDIDGELTCVCESEPVRKVEAHFRKMLYYMKHFKADNNFEPFFRVKRSFDSTGCGVHTNFTNIKKTDDKNNIVSREFKDVFEDESALELMHDPVLTLRPDKDADRMEFYTDLLADSIPIKLFGHAHYSFSPWDSIAYLRGVEPILLDMYDRPEYQYGHFPT